MGGERDLGDFAIIGAHFDARVAAKTDVKPLHWTHFHVGCLANKPAVQRSGAKPRFKVVGCLSLDKCIPKLDVKYLNTTGPFLQVALHQDGSVDAFDIDHGYCGDRRMSIAFKSPFVAEILGGGYEKVQNETFEMLRHPRIKKIHHDRTWEDTVTMNDLQQMAKQQWTIPNADALDSHARDVAILAKKYASELDTSQFSVSEYETTQESTQRTSQPTTVESDQHTPSHAVVQETQQVTTPHTCTTVSTTQCPSSTQRIGIQASKAARILVREDTSERLDSSPSAQPLHKPPVLPTPPSTGSEAVPSSGRKRSFVRDVISPPSSKRKKLVRTPLRDASGKRNLGAFECDSQERTIHVFAEEGWNVKVHTGPQKGE